MPSPPRLRIGTRGSRLAQWQAEWVAEQLRRTAGVEVELVTIRTVGDRTQSTNTPIAAVTAPGAFTKEIQRWLLDGRVDLAVHSLKDLPTEEPPGATIGAVPRRERVADVFVSRRFASLADLPQGAVIGTGSPRRRAQLWHVRPDLDIRDIRGNVETRLRKLESHGDDPSPYDAIVLAEAGLRRLDLASHITEVLPQDVMLPAVGQGALAIEVRQDDRRSIAAVGQLDHPPTHAAVAAERALLATLRAGCLAPVAALGEMDEAGRCLRLQGVVLSGDGKQRLHAAAEGPAADPAALGQRVAEDLLRQGATRLIAAAHGSESG